MSRPRVRRTVEGTRARSSTDLKAAIAAREEPSYIPVGLYGIRFTLKTLGVQQCRQLLCSRGRVVDAGEHHVLDEDLPAAQREVAVALRENVRQGIAVVHRHQVRAQPRIGCVDREREPDRELDFVDESSQTRQPAHGGDRRTPVRDSDLRQAAGGCEHLIDVQEGFAHAHEDEMVHGLEPAEVQHLVEDLRRAQVAPEAHRPGRTERARERAARLRGDADRTTAVAVAHQDRLHGMPVRRAKEGLDGAVR